MNINYALSTDYSWLWLMSLLWTQ